LTAARTLPDSIAGGLDVLFVGINPSIYSAERGHYFARPGNRFWPCLSRSVLSRRARAALGTGVLGPQHDTLLLAYGIGFTDIVKRPTVTAGEVSRAEFVTGVEHLVSKITTHRPRIACFHGVTAYRSVHDVLAGKTTPVALGLQAARIGSTRLFLVPNPSGANAHFTRDDQVRWYDAVAAALGVTP
jgi:TDG/mug DNA glycosylase family protein